MRADEMMGGGPSHLTTPANSTVGGDAHELREGDPHRTPHSSIAQYKSGNSSLHPSRLASLQ